MVSARVWRALVVLLRVFVEGFRVLGLRVFVGGLQVVSEV